MNYKFFIAKRYLFTKKSGNVINIISGISVVGVAVGTMALIVVLSVFNGFDSLVRSLFHSFDPELKIIPAEGKVFAPDSAFYFTLNSFNEIAAYAEVLEENALLEYNGKQHIATLKGVSEAYKNTSGIDSMMIDGNFTLKSPSQLFAVAGYGVAQTLGIGLRFINPITVYVPTRNKVDFLNPENAFNIKTIYPVGIFAIQEEFDSKYVFVPLEFMQHLLNYQSKLTSLEIKTVGLSERKTDKLRDEIQQKLGEKFRVLNRYQQHETMYKIMQSEKLAIFFILIFIIIVAALNVVGSLTMLIIEKKGDIKILQSMGSKLADIRSIFTAEGFMIIFLGSLAGLFFGLLICFIQLEFEVISFPGSGIITAYPVEVRWFDILLTFVSVNSVGYLLSRLPVRYISNKFL
ncbi:MAG TPA: hypothetical protein DCQ31_18855 [Bacteroidales bacterium]|nr:hypothetical protein [Bacteroidales bacterium]